MEIRAGSFEEINEAQLAVGRLRQEGFAGREITLMSSEPVHIAEGEGKKSLIGLFAVAGGIVGGVGAAYLTAAASRQVGLVTGGMPIVAPWAFGIIVFEMIALGAILATVARMIYEARLARRSPLAQYGEVVARGKIVVAVECSDDERAKDADRALARSGAGWV